MALTLYVGSKRLSSWSLRPYLALAHAGAEFTTEVILLDQADTKAKIRAVNPAARVPVLHDGDLVVHDSLAICEYVAELYPNAGLWPADRKARARARSLAAEMHSGFQALRQQMPMELVTRKPGQGRTPESLADIARVQDIWKTALAASGGPFLFGAFTIADAFFTPVAGRFRTYGVELDRTCRDYADALLSYPPMAAWIAAAGLEAELLDHA